MMKCCVKCLSRIKWLVLGIESSSKHVRDGVKERFDNFDIESIVKKVRDMGFL